MKKKWLSAAIATTLLAPSLVACTKSETKEPEGERVLRIAASSDYGDEGEWFRQQFTEIFEYANPNIKIEYVPIMSNSWRYGYAPLPEEQQVDPLEKMKELMMGDNPVDLVMFNLNEMKDLLGDNLLQPLDPLISRDKFDTTDIVPVVMDGLRSASTDGQLYALAPIFNSSVLVYNEDIFDQAGVEYPTNDMTWDQLFDLARRVTKPDASNPIYGFNFYSQSYSDLMGAAYIYSGPLGLTMFDENVEKMTVDTKEWEKVWNTLIQLEKEKIMPSMEDFNNPEIMAKRNSSEDNPFGYNDFMSGRLAMTFMQYGELAQIDNANRDAARFKGYTPIRYNVVTMPSHPEYPKVVPNIGLTGTMGINAKAMNSDDAWRFLKFINGPDWARAKAKNNYQLVSRKSYNTAKEGSNLNMEAFYNIKPALTSAFDNYRLYNKYPNLWEVQDIGRRELQQVSQGQKSIKEALQTWQTEGDAALKRIKENQGQNPDVKIQSDNAG